MLGLEHYGTAGRREPARREHKRFRLKLNGTAGRREPAGVASSQHEQKCLRVEPNCTAGRRELVVQAPGWPETDSPRRGYSVPLLAYCWF